MKFKHINIIVDFIFKHTSPVIYIFFLRALSSQKFAQIKNNIEHNLEKKTDNFNEAPQVEPLPSCYILSPVQIYIPNYISAMNGWRSNVDTFSNENLSQPLKTRVSSLLFPLTLSDSLFIYFLYLIPHTANKTMNVKQFVFKLQKRKSLQVKRNTSISVQSCYSSK